MKEIVMTVTGPILASQLGLVLAHEHLYCDISTHSGKSDNVLQDCALMARELKHFQRAGGGSVIEMTCVGIGRDAVQLKKISEASGVPIVSGIAFYDQSTYPDWVNEAEVAAIADYFVKELEVGTGGVRAGLIGELMSHNEPVPNAAGYTLHMPEKRVFQAAARAQQQTGATISTHASLGRAGWAQLAVLEAAGADLSRVVIGHCDAHWHADEADDLAYYLPILQRGAYCQFDMIGWDIFAPDEIRADRLAALICLGYEKQLLLSTDTCRRSQLKELGGRGFDYLQNSFLPLLRERGVTEAQLYSLLVDSPRRLLGRPTE